MKLNNKHRVLSVVILMLVMMLSFASVVAFADDGTGTNVAKIGDTEYATLAEAIAAAKDGKTVTLLADATEDVTINKNITLDLGTKTLTNTGAGKATITIADGATVTVKNGNVVGGTGHYNIAVGTSVNSTANLTLDNVTATAGNTGSSMIDNWGTLTITSGTYTGGLDVVKSEEGSTLTINGGTFTLDYATNGYTGVILTYGTTTITGGEFIQSLTTTGRWNHPQVILAGVVEGYTSSVTITGGTYTNKMSEEDIFRGVGKATSDNFEVSGGTFNKSISDSYFKTGYIPVKNADGTYGVKEGKFVVEVGSTGYETFDEALNAANASSNSKTIYLRENLTVDQQIVIKNKKGKRITLDLKGFTLTSTYAINTAITNGSYALVNNTPLTIKNGTFAAGQARAIGALAALTLDGATVTQTLTGSHACVAFCANSKSYSVKNSTINGAYSLCNFANNATITISDSTLTGTGNVLYHNGSNYGLKLTVKNTTITSSGGCGVYISGSTSAQENAANQNGAGGYQKASFTGCTISGAENGIEVKYTDLTLTDCKVSTTATESSYKQENNGPAASGFAVVSTDNAMDNATPKPEGTIIIKGEGKYTGPVGLGSLESVKDTYKDFKDKTIKVSGGTFSNAVLLEYCADGFTPTQNEDGTYGVKKEYIEVADEKELRQALYAAATDGTVTKIRLTGDITLEMLYAAENFGTEKIEDNAAGDTFNRYKLGVHPTAEDPDHWNPLVINQTQEKRVVYGAYYHMSAADERIARLVVKAGQNIVLDLNGHTIQKNARATHGDWSNTCTDIIGNYGTLEIKDSAGTNGTIKGNGYISCNGAVLHNYAGATMTVGKVNIDGYAAGMTEGTGQYVISNEGGNVTLNGTYVHDTATSASLLVNTAGTMTVTGNATLNHPATKTVNVKGGTVKIESADITSDNYAIYAAGGTAEINGNVTVTGSGKLAIDADKGGAITKAVGVDMSAPDGYRWVDGADGKQSLTKIMVAEVNGKKYATLADAIAAATNGQTVTLLADVDLTETLIIKNKTITLDLNGKTISNSTDIWNESTYSWSLISVRDNGDLTINDTAGGGTLKAKENDCFALDVYAYNTNNVENTKLTINDGNYIGNVSAVYAFTGKVTINGGHFSIQQKQSGSDPYRLTLNCYDSSYTAGRAGITVNGGTFENFDPRNNLAEGAGTSFVASGVGVDKNTDGTFTAKSGMVAQIVDANGNSVKAYATLADAIAAVKDGETVTLIADVDLTETLIIKDKTITLDLNGKKLSTSKNANDNTKHYYAIDNYGTFTLRDSSAAQTGEIRARGIENLGSGKMVIESGKIVAIDTNGGAAIWNLADLTIQGGTFVAEHVGASGDQYGPGCVYNNGKLTINGGTFKSANKRTYAIVSKSGAVTITPAEGKTVEISGAHGGLGIDGGTAIINGGSYASDDYYGLYVSNDEGTAEVTVTGGTFDGKEYSAFIGSDGSNSVDSKLIIKGGTFNKPIHAQENTTQGAIQVSGGTFSEAVPNDYCAEFFKPVQNADGKYTVEKVKTNNVEISFGGTGGRQITVGVDGGISIINNHTQEFATGELVSLTATAKDNAKFLFWLDSNRRIVSTNATYQFYVDSDISVTAQFYTPATPATPAEGKRYVIFIDMNNYVAGYADVAFGSTVTAPDHLTFANRTFDRWYVDGHTNKYDVGASITVTKGDKDPLYVHAKYTATDTLIKVYIDDKLYGKFAYGSYVTVTAEESTSDGKFAGWYIGDALVSTKREYSFRVASEVRLTKKYDVSGIESKAIINMFVADRTEENTRIVYEIRWELPENCKITSGGLLLTKFEENKDKLTVENKRAEGITHRSITSTASGLYRCTVNLSNASSTIYAKAYISYIDADGKVQTIYTKPYTSVGK